jgi:hypothetical protein
LPAFARPVRIDGGAQTGVTVNGNGFAMLVENSGNAILTNTTFAGGTAALGPSGFLQIDADSTLQVSGDLNAGRRAEIDNYGSRTRCQERRQHGHRSSGRSSGGGRGRPSHRGHIVVDQPGSSGPDQRLLCSSRQNRQ